MSQPIMKWPPDVVYPTHADGVVYLYPANWLPYANYYDRLDAEYAPVRDALEKHTGGTPSELLDKARSIGERRYRLVVKTPEWN